MAESGGVTEAVGGIGAMGLGEALDLLRAEVTAAQSRAEQADIRFPVQSITVELKVGLTRTAGGRAGFKVPFLEVGGDGSIAGETVHTITIVLGEPMSMSGHPVRVTDMGDEPKG